MSLVLRNALQQSLAGTGQTPERVEAAFSRATAGRPLSEQDEKVLAVSGQALTRMLYENPEDVVLQETAQRALTQAFQGGSSAAAIGLAFRAAAETPPNKYYKDPQTGKWYFQPDCEKAWDIIDEYAYKHGYEGCSHSYYQSAYNPSKDREQCCDKFFLRKYLTFLEKMENCFKCWFKGSSEKDGRSSIPHQDEEDGEKISLQTPRLIDKISQKLLAYCEQWRYETCSSMDSFADKEYYFDGVIFFYQEITDQLLIDNLNQQMKRSGLGTTTLRQL